MVLFAASATAHYLKPLVVYLGVQPRCLDLVLMNIVKTNYQSKVRHWLKENPGALYDKYVFIQVFKEVWQKSAKVEYAIKGLEDQGST